MDFDVDEFGNLNYGPAETILPLDGDEPLPGVHRFYDVNDVWGTADHNKLYLAVTRGGTGTAEALIYDLNTLTSIYDEPEVRTIHIGFDNWQPGGWQDADPSSLPDCNNVLYPQFVPTCYAQPRMAFNASGTRLYLNSGLGRDLQDFDTEYWGLMRIETGDMAAGVLPLADWNLAGPELVFANDLNDGGPSGGRPRPDANPYVLPSPEILVGGNEALNADQCVSIYSEFPDGDVELQSNNWQTCIDDEFVVTQDIAWESPNSGLFGRYDFKGKGSWSLYRSYVWGQLAGTEEKLLGDNVWSADTGL
jgi:hypothetical protein